MHLGTGELILILLIITLLFGAGRIPQLADALGRGMRNFKQSLSGGEEERRPPDKGRS